MSEHLKDPKNTPDPRGLNWDHGSDKMLIAAVYLKMFNLFEWITYKKSVWINVPMTWLDSLLDESVFLNESLELSLD